jgi:hypothetical protein
LPTFAHCFGQIFCGCISSFAKQLRSNHIRIISAAVIHHKWFLHALINCAPVFIFIDCGLILKFLWIFSLGALQL